MAAGTFGFIVALAASVSIARSIIRPLAKLETAALGVAKGEGSIHLAGSDPLEFQRLGRTLNYMTEAINERGEELRLANEELKDRNKQLLDARLEASTDAMTGLNNHRAFRDALDDVVTKSAETNRELSLIIVDIDNFKSINDTLGHLFGDRVLREVAESISMTIMTGHVYRYGGDEFSVLLPDTNIEKAASLAEQICDALRYKEMPFDISLTISAGVASLRYAGDKPRDLFAAADTALGWAKAAGKNKVVCWDETRGAPLETRSAYMDFESEADYLL
jgi:diguanylate cyclase (GGDEF)-like protein